MSTEKMSLRSSGSKDEGQDKKATENLMRYLETLKPETPKKSKLRKQKSPCIGCSPKGKYSIQSNKITNWLQKDLQSTSLVGAEKIKKQAKTSRSREKTKRPTLDVKINKSNGAVMKTKSSKTIVKNESFDSVSDMPTLKKKLGSKKSRAKLRRSDSFEKYGMVLPTFKDIIKEQQNLEDYRRKVEDFETLSEDQFDMTFSLADLEQTHDEVKILLDCKNLTLNELSESFKEYRHYLSDIFTGKQYCERHYRYNNYDTKYKFTSKDLSYSPSMTVFSFEQKDHLMGLLTKEFDPESKLMTYFFKVLLPELCLKIFCDCHNMNVKEATMYLEKRPVVN